jgi:integrase
MKGHIRERSPGHYAIVLDVEVNGRRKRRWHSFAGTKRQAQVECARLIAEINKGSYVDRSRMAVADYVRGRIDQWEAAPDGITARTAQRYRQLLKHQIEPHLGDKHLQKLSPSDIEAWHTALHQGGSGLPTIKNAHHMLQAALRDAKRDRLVVFNPCEDQPPPRRKGDKEPMAIVRDVPEFVAQLREHAGPLFYPLAIVGLFCGMRLGEILALRAGSIELDARMIHVTEALEETAAHGVRFKPPKTGAGRRDITMPQVVIEVLREHRRKLLELRMQMGRGRLMPDDLLFTNLEGRPLRTSRISSDWGVLMERLGRPEITFHALRHTHASQLIAKAIDVVTISRRLGHSNPNVTLGIYAHMFTKTDRAAAAVIDEALG